MAEAFENAKKLWSLLSLGSSPSDEEVAPLQREVRQLQSEVRQRFSDSFSYMGADDNERAAFNALPLNTPHDVVEFSTKWCKVWQRRVKQTLVKHKIDQAIGAIRGI
jgi:hypothetical protein